MRIKTIIWKVSLILMLGVLSAYANVISFNLSDSSKSFTLIDTNVFSEVASDTNGWEEIDGPGTEGTYVYTNVDNSTMDVSMSYSWVSGAPYAYGGSASRWGAGGPSPSFTLTDIPYEYYYVIVYVGGYDTTTNGYVSNGTMTYYFDFSAVSSDISLVRTMDTTFADGTDPGNYAVFGSELNPLSGDTTLTVQRTGGGAAFIGGIQVVEVVPPPDVISFNLSDSSKSFSLIDTNSFVEVAYDSDGWEEINSTNAAGTYVYENIDNSTMDVSMSYSWIAGAPYAYNGSASRWGAGGPSPSFTLSDVPYNEYYVIVYVGGYSTTTNGYVSAGATTYYFDFSAVSVDATPKLTTDTNYADGTDPGNYAVFGSKANPLSGNTTLTVQRTGGQLAFIGGIQVVEVTSTPALDAVSLQIDCNGETVIVGSTNLSSAYEHTLQMSTNLSSGMWSNIATVTGIVSTNWMFTPSSPQFFRILSQ